MISVDIGELRKTVIQILAIRGMSIGDASVIAEDLISAELEGKKTHGVTKLYLIDELLASRQGPPAVVREFGAVEIINGNKEIGQLAGLFAVQRASSLARRFGVGVVGLVNVSRYARLAFLGEAVAAEGNVGIIINDAGPPAVAPYGGTDPILGTNPICFAFPGNPPVIIDFSSAQSPWASIRNALLAGSQLPPDAFIDARGASTTNPHDANAVRAFGGAKGYALCLAIELLCGGLLTGIVGTEVATEYDLGNMIIALNPAAFGSHDLQDVMLRIRSQIETSAGSPRVPGDRSRESKRAAMEAGYIPVPDRVWTDLHAMAAGSGSTLSVNKTTN